MKFKLEPVKATKKILVRDNIIEIEKELSCQYNRMTEIVDCYHRMYIDESLASVDMDIEKLGNLAKLIHKDKLTRDEKKLKMRIEKELRETIAKSFSDNENFTKLFKRPLFTELLPKFIASMKDAKEGDLKLLEHIQQGKTTMFSGYHENRKNMYSAKAQATSITNRLINENFPLFVRNKKKYEDDYRVPELLDWIKTACTELLKSLDVNSPSDLFMLDYYRHVLTQSGIDSYNQLIGIINTYVNQYNQSLTEDKQELPLLDCLYKQILSEEDSHKVANFKLSGEMLSEIRNEYYEFFILRNERGFSKSDLLIRLIKGIRKNHLKGLFIQNGDKLNYLSNCLTGNYNTILLGLAELWCEEALPRNSGENDDKYQERKDRNLKKLCKNATSLKHQYVSLEDINKALTIKGYDIRVEKYFARIGKTQDKRKNLIEEINSCYYKIKHVVERTTEKEIRDNDKERIKCLLDAIKDLKNFIAPLSVDNLPIERERDFYIAFQGIWDDILKFTPLYNKVRSFLTKKPYSTDKIKLRFGLSQPLNGWNDDQSDSNNGTQYGGFLFRKKNVIGEYDYFLGVSKDRFLFREKTGGEGEYERLDYYQMKFETLKRGFDREYFNHVEELRKVVIDFMNLNSNGTGNETTFETLPLSSLLAKIKETPDIYDSLLSNENFSMLNSSLIEYLKNTMEKQKRIPENIKKEYLNRDFVLYTDVLNALEECCNIEKMFGYFAVPDSEIKRACGRKVKPLYLFKIVNKDLTFAEGVEDKTKERKSRGTDNLHTMYFKALMECKGVFDIGSGSIYFREKSKQLAKKKATHNANEPLENKNPKNKKGTSIFSYDLFKDKRFREDTYLFHLSIKQNYKSGATACDDSTDEADSEKFDMNSMVRNYIHNTNDPHIIGIDLGERNLVYYTIIDMNGRIIKQDSLNVINTVYKERLYETDYQKLLVKRKKEMEENQKSWMPAKSIRDLKDGFLSRAIFEITQLIVKYNAIVVLENLNIKFKQSRQKAVAEVYRKFDTRLTEKLRYLVDKKLYENEPGGLLKGLQLVNRNKPKSNSLLCQDGIMFYIPAWCTSKIDPVTGFVNLFTSSELRYTSIKMSQSFFGKFSSICYNKDKDWFEFSFDYKKFPQKTKSEKTDWTICTNGERISTYREPNSRVWNSISYVLTDEFKKLFQKNSIDITKGELIDKIVRSTNKSLFSGKEKSDNDEGYMGLYRLLQLTLQMRNNIPNTDVDYIISPVANKVGELFDSRDRREELPYNADANGAYNIARKGLMVAQHIRNVEQYGWPDISNKAWLNYAQQQENKSPCPTT